MTRVALSATLHKAPAPSDILALLKPITWFPPMWAFGCGVVSSGVPIADRWIFLLLGIVLAGPAVCGTSQAVNDWFDRHVDAINEPDRPIPSGRVPGRWGLGVALAGTLISLLLGAALEPWVLLATCFGLAAAWAYSAPPLRLKTSGWWGPATVALSYEGLSWFTGAAVMAGALPSGPILAVLLLYSLGAHGIMTLNDFKALKGDRLTGVRSLPVALGPARAARLACLVMAMPQLTVAVLLYGWGHGWSAAAVAASFSLQVSLMPRLLRDPAGEAPWYNATGVTLYVLGMMAAAIGLGSAA
jgi:chlorophyll/bacteriochlorophyll a synthase